MSDELRTAEQEIDIPPAACEDDVGAPNPVLGTRVGIEQGVAMANRQTRWTDRVACRCWAAPAPVPVLRARHSVPDCGYLRSLLLGARMAEELRAAEQEVVMFIRLIPLITLVDTC
ncbi:cysteine-rich receptor-like protein kinase 10 isoform X1 [Panicum miliaceum]|uniref:Cysteine-rich receptor-like protein kinase 10 isoform X1 n=1 Tax=Panicum miliaceum TaxID=4540 RepID=A0A3L6P9H0_PANMI|nr:cysteine-rich receptor-like protein kinase 10 isoform X1 [Panicum miliaceum]